MNKHFFYILGVYTLAISIMNLIFSAITIGIVNIVLLCYKESLFEVKDWCYGYVLGFIVLFILNLDIFKKLIKENK